LLLVSMAAICAFGVIATLTTLITGGPSRAELAQVAPVELDGGQGARGGHEGSEPDRRDGKRPQGKAFAEPEEQDSESQSQAAGSTAEPAPAVVVAAPTPPSDDQSSGEGAGSPAAPAPDPAGEATAAPPATSSRDDDATGDRDNARGDDN
jgi:hypothetical protein